VTRPLVAAASAFLVGAAAGGLSALPLGVAFVIAVVLRRAGSAALAIFGLAGALSAETAPEPAGVLPRGTYVLEGEVRSHTDDRLELDLIGAAPVGAALRPASGRMIAFGECAPSDRIRALARTRTVAPFGFEGERAASPYTIAHIERCLPLGPEPLFAPIDRLRQEMRSAIDRALPSERAMVVRAMAIGDRIRGRPDLKRDFADSGLSHVLAVSGQHLSIIASLFTVMLAAIFARAGSIRDRWGTRRPAALVAIVFVVLYTILVGAPPSAVRAAVMVSIMLIGALIDRRREAWSALALAAVLMIALEPPVLQSLSFQLSFAAVAGLLAFERRVKSLLSGWPRPLRAVAAVVATTLAATVGTAPLLAHHFGRISLIGLLANLPAAPLASLGLLPLSLLGSLAGAIDDRLGRPILVMAGWCAELLIRLAQISASAPLATISVSGLETIAFGALLFCLITRRRIAIAALLLFTVVAIERWPRFEDELVVTVLPVGQGTSVLIETPEGARVLVDTGPPDTAERVLLPYLMHRRISHFDLVVLSHPHADHTGGFELLARRASIERVWTNGDVRDAPADLSRHRAETVTSTVTNLGSLRLEVLHASRDAPRVNDGSIVLRLVYGQRRILLAGDAEAAAEREMLESDLDLSADVLVVGHHGSKSSSSDAFLDAVRPKVAIIPVGRDNTFHHPHPGVLERLARQGARVHRTDLHGAVTVRTDGAALSARPFLDASLVPASECCFSPGTP
jgi:competence protein ComEC